MNFVSLNIYFIINARAHVIVEQQSFLHMWYLLLMSLFYELFTPFGPSILYCVGYKARQYLCRYICYKNYTMQTLLCK